MDTHIREEKGGSAAAAQGNDHGEAAVPLECRNVHTCTYPLCSPGRRPGNCSRFNLKDYSLWKEIMLDQGNTCEEKEEQQRRCVTD